jgi:TM2 domain-containing membrane protein YozV
MNCSYHSQNAAVVSCNGCGKPLCPACDHRIKGFPYCQDCIVLGVDLLRQQQSQTNHIPFVKKRTSPVVATILSMICPGLGAAYNGQTIKALVYFGVFIGLFQMALLSGTAVFVFGFMGMWCFAALDAWRTAQMIRSGLTPDVADDILVKRFSGNPKLWGIVLSALGLAFLFQNLFPVRGLIRGLLPVMLIGLGIYVLRGYIFKPKTDTSNWDQSAASTSFALTNPRYNEVNYRARNDFSDRSRSGSWRDI